MQIKTLLLTTVLTTAGFAETSEFNPPLQVQSEPFLEKNSFGYVGVGIGPLLLPFPNASLGFRTEGERFGFDVGASVATIGVITHLKGFVNCLWYPMPSNDGRFYMGLGVCGGPWFYEGTTATAAGNIVIGKEMLSRSGNKTFFQADIAYPSFILHRQHFIDDIGFSMPFVTFSYGWGF